MLFSYIFLATFMQDLPVGLALCIIPFILGWLFAYGYHKVSKLNSDNAELTLKVSDQTAEITDLRLKLAKAEADVEHLRGDLHKSKDALIMCESDRNALKEQLNAAGGGTAKAPSKAATTAPVAEVKTVTFNGTKYKWDDLKIVEGIGPKIAELLNNAGITTWDKLSVTSPYQLREILDAAGPQFNVSVPDTWPQQADLAAKESWDALKKLQDELDGGRAAG